MPSVGVVIRPLNEARHIPKLLECLDRQSATPDASLNLDSRSSDKTVVIAQARRRKMESIASSLFSLGRSLNTGIPERATETVVVVPTHVFPVHNYYLENLLKPFRNPDVVMAYGLQVGDSFSEYSERLLLERWFPGEGDA